MKKDKHNAPGKGKKRAKPSFIKFSKMQRAYLNEILARQQKEFNEVLGTVYEDMGLAERILRAPPGTFVLRKDFSGLDVMPTVIVPKVESPKKPEPEKKTKPTEKPVKE